VDTSNFSEYPESFEESFASESQGSPPLKPKQGTVAQPTTTTIDDLISDDEDLTEAEITPASRGKQDRDEDGEEGDVRSSRADSIDTISRQRPASFTAREAFGSTKGHQKSGMLSPVDGDDDGVYGLLDESLQPDDDDPSHSAILDESGEHLHEDDQQELNHSRRSNQEDEDDYRQITQSSSIKRSLFNAPAPAPAPAAAASLNNRSNEDDDDYFDDDFEESEGGEGKHDQAHGAAGGEEQEDEGSYVESLEEEIEEADDDEDQDFSYGGASSGEEDMLNRKEKKDQLSSLPTRGSSSLEAISARPAANTAPGRRATPGMSAAKYDHNSSDEEDSPYLPSSRRSVETEKKSIAKTDENSDDEDLYPSSTTAAATAAPSRGSGSLFGQQKKPQPKYDHNSGDESEGDDVPETGSASDFSAGGSDGESSFLHEESLERGDFDAKARGDSNEFSMSEQEISGSHILDGFDYTTNALPPARRLGGR
jgi:hypothetical protein